MISALLADDSISELEMMLYLIKKENLPLQAATAEDGEQALQYIQHHFVDLLITDIRMPFSTVWPFAEKLWKSIQK